MLKEPAKIAKVSSEAIWVVASQKSACGSCAAKKGCGTSTLAEWAEQKSLLRVDIPETGDSQFHIDDDVMIGIPEDVIVGGSMLLYVVPLFGLVLGALIGHKAFATDVATAVFAFVGLFLGGYLASRFSASHSGESRLHPVLLEHTPADPVR